MAVVARHSTSGAVVEPGQPLNLPLICTVCLGDEQNIRVVRDSQGAECKLCGHAFATFRWRRGDVSGPQMQTLICRECGEARGACQSCVLDLAYRIPLRVRDAALRILKEEGGLEDDVAAVLEAVAANW